MPSSRRYRRRGGVLALALAIALPAPSLAFLLGLSFAALHGPHRVLVRDASSCTDIVLRHDQRVRAGAPGAEHAASATSLASPGVVMDGPEDVHVICMSQAQDPRASTARSADCVEARVSALPLTGAREVPARLCFASSGGRPEAALSVRARSLVLRL